MIQRSLLERGVDVSSLPSPLREYTVVSLFSGCGGLDLGFTGGFRVFGRYYDQNPFRIVWANDIDEKAADTYRKNIGDHIECRSITDVDKSLIPSADVVIGGFPCQDFSMAGKRRGLDAERGRLYLQMKEVISHVRPLAFLAENVSGLTNMQDGRVLEIIESDFRNVKWDGGQGYHVVSCLLDAADYSVPQHRRRVFIVGVRKGLGGEFRPPMISANTPMTAREAIDDLWGRENDDSIPNHGQISRAKFYPNRRMQGNTRIKDNEPSVTIRSEHHGNIEAHYRTLLPDEEDMKGWRRLSVRECARLQSFPDDFVFHSSGSDNYKMIGNAVPPILGWHMARALYIALDGSDT